MSPGNGWRSCHARVKTGEADEIHLALSATRTGRERVPRKLNFVGSDTTGEVRGKASGEPLARKLLIYNILSA
jgi:hypothetical protein